jgi:hypothetical protein
MVMLTTTMKAAAMLSASLLAVAVLSVAPSAIAVAKTTAAKSTAAKSTATWLVKGQDLEPWCNGSKPNGATCTSAGLQSIGLLRQAAKDKVALPAVAYRLCGQWNGTIYGQSDYTTCEPGDTLVVEDYNSLKSAVSNGVFTKGGLHTAVYDIESWPYTPTAQWHNPVPSIRKALSIARKAGVSLIVSPGGSLAMCSNCWHAATQYGALGVAIQSQGWGWVSRTRSWDLATWYTKTAQAVADVRRARKKYGTATFAMLGLGTNTSQIHSAMVLEDEYNHATQVEKVTYFWMNANNWGKPKSVCPRADGGPGCPQIAVQFWMAEGLTRPV